jgi:hypothetical protein
VNEHALWKVSSASIGLTMHGCDLETPSQPMQDTRLEVVTPAGRAMLPKASAGFEAAHAALEHPRPTSGSGTR